MAVPLNWGACGVPEPLPPCMKNVLMLAGELVPLYLDQPARARKSESPEEHALTAFKGLKLCPPVLPFHSQGNRPLSAEIDGFFPTRFLYSDRRPSAF